MILLYLTYTFIYIYKFIYVILFIYVPLLMRNRLIGIEYGPFVFNTIYGVTFEIIISVYTRVYIVKNSTNFNDIAMSRYTYSTIAI